MKKLLLFTFMLLYLISFTGCKSPLGKFSEIQEISFIRLVSIDKVPGKDLVRITISSKRASQTGKSLEKQVDLMSQEGETIFEAVRKFQKFSDKLPYWGHVDYLLIDEEAVKDDILKYLDFFCREHQFRLKARVIIVKNATAEEAIKTTNTKEYFLSDRLKQLFKDVGGMSVSGEVEIAKLMEIFDNRNMSAYIPCIRIENIEKKEGEDKDKNDVILDGYGVFEDTKLYGYLNEKESRGLNWITNNIQSGIIVAHDEAGGKVSLEILDASSKTVPHFNEDNSLSSIDVKIRMTTTIGEQQSTKDIMNKKNFELFKNQQNEYVKSEVLSALKYAQERKLDFFGIGMKINKYHPIRWESLKENWKEEFSNVKFNVEVDSKINRTYIIRQATRSKGEK